MGLQFFFLFLKLKCVIASELSVMHPVTCANLYYYCFVIVVGTYHGYLSRLYAVLCGHWKSSVVDLANAHTHIAYTILSIHKYVIVLTRRRINHNTRVKHVCHVVFTDGRCWYARKTNRKIRPKFKGCAFGVWTFSHIEQLQIIII